MTSGDKNSTGWRMVGICFVVQNCSIAMATTAYGTALSTIQSDLHTSRAMASSALGIMLLSLGLLSPVVGNLLLHIAIRSAMMIGAILSAVGYVIVAYATSLIQVQLAYGLLIGPGACLLGPLTVSTLVSRWFEKDGGKAFGIANMPLSLLIASPIAAFLVMEGGRNLLFVVMTIIFIALIPLAYFVVEPRRSTIPINQPNASEQVQVSNLADQSLSNRTLLKDSRFWLLSISMGILTGAASAFVTHAVPLAMSKGVDLAMASSIMSAYGLGTLMGTLIFGTLIDRIGPLLSLIVNCTLQIVLWITLIAVYDFSALLLISGLIGCGMGATVALHSAALNTFFGRASFGRAMGLSYFLKIPFLFGYAPIFGYIFDITGKYDTALLMNGLALGCVLIIFLWIHLNRRRWALSAP